MFECGQTLRKSKDDRILGGTTCFEAACLIRPPMFHMLLVLAPADSCSPPAPKRAGSRLPGGSASARSLDPGALVLGSALALAGALVVIIIIIIIIILILIVIIIIIITVMITVVLQINTIIMYGCYSILRNSAELSEKKLLT